MRPPNTYADINETGCCAIPNVKDWDKKIVKFENRHFIRMYTKSFLHVPLNMAKVMKSLNEAATSANANLEPEQAIILSRDISAWKAEQLYGVSKPIEGLDNVTLNGTFITMVFEGPYQDAKKWYDTAIDYAKGQRNEVDNVYFFYTTCPKCAKHYGKNYTISLTQIAN